MALFLCVDYTQEEGDRRYLLNVVYTQTLDKNPYAKDSVMYVYNKSLGAKPTFAAGSFTTNPAGKPRDTKIVTDKSTTVIYRTLL